MAKRMLKVETKVKAGPHRKTPIFKCMWHWVYSMSGREEEGDGWLSREMGG